YIGFGSFYLSFPNYFNTLKRWVLSHSSDVTEDYIEKLGKEFLTFLNKKVKTITEAEKSLMGFEYFQKSITSWKKGLNKNARAQMENKIKLQELLPVLDKLR